MTGCAKACSEKNVSNPVNGISNSNKNTKIVQILLNKISIKHRAKLCDSSYWCYTHVTFRKTQAVEQVEQRHCQHRNISALCKLRKFWPPHGAPATRERPSTMEHPATPDPQRTRVAHTWDRSFPESCFLARHTQGFTQNGAE